MEKKKTVSRETMNEIESNSMKLERVKDLILITSDFLETKDAAPHGNHYDTLMLCALDYVLEVIEYLDSFGYEKPKTA